MSVFSFMTATEILFGRGSVAQAPARIATFGAKVALVHGARSAPSAGLRAGLAERGCDLTAIAVPGEPVIDDIVRAMDLARGAQVIVAMGGGAVIDAGKALAAMLPATRPLMDHLEVVGQGLPLDHPPLPFVAIPTTAGTGAEVTRNAVIGVPEHGRKVSLRDPTMLPRLAIVDPGLCDGCPRAITLASGLDAITQVIEPYLSTRANALTDALCRDAIPRGLAALRTLMAGESAGARDEMSWVSLCGGLALANAGLGAVHGLAGPLGGMTGAAHGAICGALLPHVLKANAAGGADPRRMGDVAGWIGAAFGLQHGTLTEAADALAAWARAQGLPGLAEQGIDQAAMEACAEAAASSSSMKANPVALSRDDLMQVQLAAR